MDLKHIIPLVIHGDDADAHRRRSFTVVTMASMLTDGSPWDTRILLYAIDRSRTRSETYDVLDAWVVWGLIQLQVGEFMSVDPFNAPIKQATGQIAGPWRGVVVAMKGDEKHLQFTLKFKQSWVSENVCSLCRASRSGVNLYTCFGPFAPHRQTTLTTERFISEAVRPSAWIRYPGFGVEMIHFDYLHVVDLSIIPKSAASVLWPGGWESLFGT